MILGKVYTYKAKEKYKKWSYTSTIGGPFFKSHPVALHSDMELCNTFQATMSSRGGMVGGVNCKSGLIYGQYIILQNSYEMTDLSLSEVFVYGIWTG